MRDPKPHDILYEQISSRLWLLAATHLKNAAQENKFPTLKPQKDNCECTSSKNSLSAFTEHSFATMKVYHRKRKQTLLELYGKSASQQYFSRNRFCFTSAPQGRMRGPAAERRFEIGTSHLPPLPRNEEDTTNLLHAGMKLEESTVAGMARRTIGLVGEHLQIPKCGSA